MMTRLAIHKKLFALSEKDAMESILNIYRKQGYGIVHFLYFASAHFAHLYRGKQSEKDEKYFASLLAADVLLPDGIALSLVHYRYEHPEISGFSLVSGYSKFAKKSLQNLNGTDFIPAFLKKVRGEFSKESISLVLYGALPEIIPNAGEYVAKHFDITPKVQNGYEPFDFSHFSRPYQDWEIRILLVGQGSPRQELFVEENRDFWEKAGVLVISVGGLFDFWGGREKRAPLWVRKIRGEWIWRLLSNPKKNTKKVLASFSSFRELFFPKKSR